jgi:hypothetical protein
MATNRSRESHFNQKITPSVFSVEGIPYSYLTDDGGSGSIFGVLPRHSIIHSVVIVEEEAANTNARFSLTVGGTAIITNAQLDINGLVHANEFDNVHIEDGGDIIFKQGTTPPTQGMFTFLILYIEHEKHNGEYTNYSET